ncbi:MAG TPA: SAF domain-containing protein [Bacillota bacterium]|nr:SAF domain-containing protein [Bacillota bacterium]HQJ37743.1 SAF domain-containing protein [Bacillota bacterium]HQL35429.1 SAF domain-containing protein [Bacillota bacterium]HRS21579.1 SAF domain-containing protein [Clostridia bacterium]HRU41772.1 SAF domain-containing protein [Candidatus Diapherotrites archaeon]
MAYSKKNKVYAVKRAALILSCIVCAVFILSAGYMLYGNVFSGEAAGALRNGNVNEAKTVMIARAKQNLDQGELLDASKAELIEIPVELAPEGAITSLSKLSGMRLKRGIAKKEIFNDMDLMPQNAVCEEGERLIEHNFAEGAVPASVTAGSIIDIKLFVKGGEDGIVVSKAAVISRSDNLLSFYLDGREQEFIKEAAAEGALFVVQYIDASQQASEVTYTPLYYKDKQN